MNMKKFVTIVFAISLAVVSCTNHNDLVLKYGKLYEADIEWAKKHYERVDSLIDCSYGREVELDFNEKSEKKLDNIKHLQANYDYAEFRFKYYTTKGFKEIVDKCIKDWNYYPYTGKYHTYAIERKPSKKGIYMCISTNSIID